MQVLLTAAEAYPALERAFLAANTEVWASFLVFDLSTRLRSPEALRIGRTWFDLVVHTLDRGVALHFVVSDVDSLARPVMHRDAWRTVRMFNAAAAVARPGAQLSIRAARHPAETGAGIRLLGWPLLMLKLHRQAARLNDLDPATRATWLRDMPDLSARMQMDATGKVRARWLHLPRMFPLTHHQKMAVIDRRLLYVGGLDLDERRFDSPAHRQTADQTWHDVQLMIEGPAVPEAQAHLETFLTQVEQAQVPPPNRRFLRTLSHGHRFAPFRFGPVPKLAEIFTGHRALLHRAEDLIYLETQYFRDRPLARALADRAKANPKLTMILLLPAAPDEVAFEGKRSLDARFAEFMQARCLRIVRRAFGNRLFVCSPAQCRSANPSEASEDPEEGRDQLHGAPLVYIHAKVSVFDEAAAIVSSANLNGRSMKWDTEAGVFLNNLNEVTDLRKRVMAHWLPRNAGPAYYALDTAMASWRSLAFRNARLAPPKRRGFILPYDFAAAEVFGRPLPMLPEEFV